MIVATHEMEFACYFPAVLSLWTKGVIAEAWQPAGNLCNQKKKNPGIPATLPQLNYFYFQSLNLELSPDSFLFMKTAIGYCG